MIIGICGKSASGKTTLSQRLLNIIPNCYHLDIDKIGHTVLEYPDVKEQISKQLNINNYNRTELADIVFSSRKEMDKVTNITWSYMKELIDDFIKLHQNDTIVLDWLLLSRTHYFDICDIKVLVTAPYETRKDRAIKRDNITEEQFNLRESATVDYNKEDFDYIVEVI